VDPAVNFQPGATNGRSGLAPPKDTPKGEMQTNQLAPGEPQIPSGFSISLGTSMSFGSSTFQIDAGYERDPLVDWSLSFSPAYVFSDSTRIAASASMSQELTLNDSADAPQTVIFSDVGLTASRRLYKFAGGGPSIAGLLSVQLPTSTASQVETLRTSLGARLSASQHVGQFSFGLSSGFRKNFHKYTQSGRDLNTGRGLVTRDGLVIENAVTGFARSGGSELQGATYFDGGTENTSMILSNGVSITYIPTERLVFGLSYNLTHAWTYDSYPLDALSGPGANAGRGRSDSHGGGLFAAYQALDSLSFGLGMNTGGATRTADDKHIRFPFYAFEGAASNKTQFFISATYTEAIGL
jgi:hypothetical protein